MNSRVTVPAPSVSNMQRGTSRVLLTQAVTRNWLIIRGPQCVIDVKPRTDSIECIALISNRLALNTGNLRRVLPVGHPALHIVAHRAHATRGGGYKGKAEGNRPERKPAAPFTTLFIALKTDNVVKSAAKQPASEHRIVSLVRKGL